SMVEEGVAPQAVANYTETESHTAFLNGDAVFLRNWPYVYGLIGTDDFPNVKKEQVGVAPLPAGPAGSKPGLGGWNFMINAASDAQDAAYQFVQFATAPEQQKFRALEGGFLPTLSELYEDQEIIDAIPVIRLAGQEALQNATPRPVSPYYSDMSLQMAEQFNNVVKGAASPEQAVQSLQESLQQIVEQAQ
ncbi:MAG: extracellular solute-binding protein, partial [Actinomycetota bacterium]